MGALLVALQKNQSLLGAECRGVGTTPFHANERGQTVKFVADLAPSLLEDSYYISVAHKNLLRISY